MHGKIIEVKQKNVEIDGVDKPHLVFIVKCLSGHKFEGQIELARYQNYLDRFLSEPLKHDEILRRGDIVRIRGAKLSEEDDLNHFIDLPDEPYAMTHGIGKTLEKGSASRHFASHEEVIHLDFETAWGQQCSVMNLPRHFKLVQELDERIVEDWMLERLHAEGNTCCLVQRRILTYISDRQRQDLDLSPIPQPMEIEYRDDEKRRVQFRVIGIQPKKVEECCKLFCTTCLKSTSFADLTKDDNMSMRDETEENVEGNASFEYSCPHCDVSIAKPCYQVKLIVQDQYDDKIKTLPHFSMLL